MGTTTHEIVGKISKKLYDIIIHTAGPLTTTDNDMPMTTSAIYNDNNKDNMYMHSERLEAMLPRQVMSKLIWLVAADTSTSRFVTIPRPSFSSSSSSSSASPHHDHYNNDNNDITQGNMTTWNSMDMQGRTTGNLGNNNDDDDDDDDLDINNIINISDFDDDNDEI